MREHKFGCSLPTYPQAELKAPYTAQQLCKAFVKRYHSMMDLPEDKIRRCERAIAYTV